MKVVKYFLRDSLGRRAVIALTLVAIATNMVLAQLVAVGFWRDISISVPFEEPFEGKKAFKKVLSLVDFQNNQTIGVELYTSVIGSYGIPIVNKASLPESDRFTPRSRLNAYLPRFLKKGLHHFDYLEQQSASHGSTQIMRSLTTLTSEFEEQADHTILIVQSDFISAGHVVSFFQYQDQPSQLLDDEVFEKIMRAFEVDYPLPKLDGAEVFLITPGQTELQLMAVRFWERAFKQLGASEVTIRASL